MEKSKVAVLSAKLGSHGRRGGRILIWRREVTAFSTANQRGEKLPRFPKHLQSPDYKAPGHFPAYDEAPN